MNEQIGQETQNTQNTQNEEAHFATASHGKGDAGGTGATGATGDIGSESGMEQIVRATLDRHATSVPPQEPPVELLLKRGKHRRRMRDALTVTGALALVFAGVVTVNAAVTSAHSGPGATGSGVPVTVAAAGHATAGSSGSAGLYRATVPKGWKPGAKLPLSTYSSVPSWVQTKDATTELGTEKKKGHHVNLGMSPEPATCLSLGSTPIVWPEGFYAEGTPLVVFDSKGRAVYVVDQGFTGVDGPALIGYGDGLRLLPGLDMTHCPTEATTGLEPYALGMIFKDTPKQ